jgi:hypothetical protein
MKIKSLIKHNLMRAAMTLLVMLPWAANAQTRECNPITTYPWTENFDSYTGTTSGSTNNLPECWNYINTCTHNSYKGYPVVYGANYTSGHSGHNFLYFESYSLSQYAQYDPQPQYAILPEMSGLAGKHITLWAYGYLSNGGTCTFKIGTMSNPADANTFAQIAEQTLTNGWQEYMFTVPETSNTYLAIMIDAASGYNVQKKVGIDDIGVFDDFSQTDDNEYTIFSAAGWGLFCDAIAGGESFNGKTVKLGADITVPRMASTGDPYFRGTFDGQGHTLTLDYGTASNPVDAQYVAPFGEITWSTSPTFRNLNISGHIYEAYTGSEAHNVGGLIGHLYGTVTIEHCTSNVTITSTGGAGGFVGLCENAVSFNDCVSSAVIHSADGNNSGFIGWSRDSGYNISFAGCVFNGKLLKVNDNSKDNGGFIGWKGDSKNVTITNCLVDPAPLGEGETMANGNSATFSREHSDHAATINNCYYTTAFGTPQGKQMHSITAGDSYVTVANAGTATTYSVSGITSYGTGIKYNNVLYAGKNEVVSLTLSNTVPASFNFTGYSVTDGASLNGSGNNYTLTMPNAEVDVVITANCTIPPVSYIDENGVAQTCTYYYPLEGTETTLGAAGQETWCVVQGTLNYSHGIQLLGNTHIILCDGAAMNIGTSDNPVSGSSYQEKEGFYGSGNNLSLYAQSGNTGALTIYSQSCSFDVKDLTIAGGNLNATTITTSPVIGCSNNLTVRRSSLEIHANGPAVQANDVTLSNVTANINSSNSSGFSCSNFTVDHSQLTVNAISYYPAIQASVITLGCTAATDFIKATCTSFLTSSYSGTVKIADGQTLYDGANTYTDTLTDAERQTIGGRKLTNVAPPTYDYIGLNGTGATHTAVVIDADNMPTALSGWYIVQGTVNYTNTIDLAGDTHIILADNAVMNVTVTGYNHGIQSTSENNYSLFVYGQTGQSGELNVTSNNRFACYIYGGDITIAGGKVTASGTMGIYAQYNNNGGNVTIKNATVTATGTSIYGILSEYGGNITIDNSNVTATGNYGIYAQNGDITIASGTVTASGTQYGIFNSNGSVTINGGQVTATGNFGIYTIGSVTINGGQVSATGNNYGIFAQESSDHITLGWTNPTDFIYVNKYYTYGTLSIAEGKTFIDEAGQTYSGTIAMVSGAYAIDGKTLYPYSENAVPYLDENGQQRYCVAYTTLTGTETELGTAGQETWYVVDSDVSFTDLTINGDIHLILVDGKTMNLNHEQGFVTLWGQANLTIYGQTNGTGTLSSLGTIGAMNITVNGGIVNVKGTVFFKEDNFIPAIWCVGDMVINGGKVYAQGDMGIVVASMGAKSDDMTTYNFTLNGGQVTAIGMSTDMGIIATGNITLGWTNPTDYIYANKYYAEGTLSIASSKTFVDENNTPYSGTIAQVDEAYAIDGKTLYPDCVVMKQVEGYEEGNGGWVFIASPVAGSIAPSEVHNLFPSAGETSNDYDLYRFDQSSTNGKEWQNWKQDEGHNNVAPGFSLVNGHGYLYATKETRTLVFAGEYTAATGSVAVPLDYDENAQFAGWNLVGNPFAVGATLSQPYYRMNAEGTALNTETEDTSVAAMEGVFVQANQDSQTVTFTAQTRGGEKSAVAALNICLSKVVEPVETPVNRGDGPSTSSGTSVLDNAIIRFDGGQTLEKFSFREGSTKIYIPQDGKDYAIVTSEGQGEMPLNFKAEENGTYTISVDVDNVEMGYLHLIDNMTGADVDLLTSPNYTFTAKTTDYESRFKLVFSADEDVCEPNEAFAFISNGNLFVNGEGTLQIFDVLGHQLFTKQLSTLNSKLSTLNYKSGVYVLRLIDWEKVRTQKIVIE